MSSEEKNLGFMLQLVRVVYLFIACFVSYQIVLISLNYIDPDFNRGFLIGKSEIWYFYKVPLYIHIISAPIIIFIGTFQLIFKRSRLHTILGKTYVLLVLFLAAPSGFIMSFYALGGLPSILNFLILSGLWAFYTFKGYSYIRKGDIEKHKHFIIGSFILANSAVLLRLFYAGNIKFQLIPIENSYFITSLLSWVPWILLFEFIQFRKKKVK